MKPAIEKTWSALEHECERWRNQIQFRSDRKDAYRKRYESNYTLIQDHFMSDDTKYLDIHKQIAILVISALEACVIEPSQPCDDDSIAIGSYVVALNVALSYLTDYINKKISKGPYSGKTVSIAKPVAFACDTPYFEIMCRMLYYEDPNQKKGGIPHYPPGYNILEWADRFYLLEYITILLADINPLVYRTLEAPTFDD